MRRFTGFTGILGLLLLWAVPVLAHVVLRSSSPAADARLDTAPRELRLSFSAPVRVEFAQLTLEGPGGPVALGPPRNGARSDSVLVVPIEGALSAGEHSVRWQIAGPDGHSVRGGFAFTIQSGAAGLAEPGDAAGPAAPGRQSPPPEHHPARIPGSGFDAESPLYAGVRWLTFVGLLGVIGVVAFRVLVLRRAAGTHADSDAFEGRAAGRAAAFGLGALALLGVALLLRLHAQSVALHGAADAMDTERVGMMLGRTVWGWGWLLQAGGMATVLAGLLLARRGRGWGWGVALAGAIALAFTPSLSGHAVATRELTALAIVADGLHVLGAGGWLGSLLLVVAVGIPLALAMERDRRAAAMADLINAFSPVALACAALVVATGVFSAWIHLGSLPELWRSGYGRTLLLKLAALTVVFGTGAYNWRRVKPSLGTDGSGRHLQRSGTVELAVGAIVLAVTAALVATPPPAETAPAPAHEEHGPVASSSTAEAQP